MDFVLSIERALLWIVVLPLIGAVLNGLWGRSSSRTMIGVVGVTSVAASFVLACIAFFAVWYSGEPIRYEVYEWFSLAVGEHKVPLMVTFVMDRLSAIMTLMVTGIGLLIHIYSLGYMHNDPGYARFFAYLNLFMASMLILVLASSMPLMFVGWEGVGLCSYLLIGYWFENPDYAKAGRKAFVVNRIGDFGILLAMFLLLGVAFSLEFDAINGAADKLRGALLPGNSVITVSLATAVGLLVLLGCAGKSAQIPLYIWLPDAMAGPTPVSALIHAATMVTAGIYLCCRVSPVLVQSSTTMAVIAAIGALTALLAASIALVQKQMKRVLAYSTVSQLGFMFAAVGMGAFSAGLFHVFTHAFFKACLFLGAGSVMHAVGAHGDADLFQLGGLRKTLPKTHWTFLVSCLAIAGIPGFSGFFSKDEILLGAALASTGHGAHYFPVPWLGWVVLGSLLLAAVFTAFYMFRLYFLTFAGEYRGDAHPHESPSNMTVPLAVLGTGAVLVGYLGFPHVFHLIPNLWGLWLEPVFENAVGIVHGGHGHGSAALSLQLMAAGSMVAFIGVFAAWAMYGKGPSTAAEKLAHIFAPIYELLLDKWRIDELYDVTVVRPMAFTARVLAGIDRFVVDGLTKLVALLVRAFGFLVSRLQTGVVFTYSAVLVIGFAFVAWWLLFPKVSVQANASGYEVEFEVAQGYGYVYRWDFNSDGRFDTTWSSNNFQQSRNYEHGEPKGGVLLIEGGRLSPRREEIHLALGEQKTLELSDFLYSSAVAEVHRNYSPKDAPTVQFGAALLSAKGKEVELGTGQIPANLLGERWHASGSGFRLPELELRRGYYRLEPNGAQVLFKGRLVSSPIAMRIGDTARIGEARLRIEGCFFVRPHGNPVFVAGRDTGSHQSVVEIRPSEKIVLGSTQNGVLIRAATFVEAIVAARNAFGHVAKKRVRVVLDQSTAAKTPTPQKLSAIHQGGPL